MISLSLLRVVPHFWPESVSTVCSLFKDISTEAFTWLRMENEGYAFGKFEVWEEYYTYQL